jgi:DNA-binding XRE family transcriptional regulator
MAGVTDDKVTAKVGETVSALLRHHGLTQTSVAALLGISVQSMNNIARGKSTPSFVTALKIAVLFGISTEALLDKDWALDETDSDTVQRHVDRMSRIESISLAEIPMSFAPMSYNPHERKGTK